MGGDVQGYINTLNELQELSVFNKIENSIGETIIIYNPDCPYAGLYSKEITKNGSENSEPFFIC